MVVWFAGMTRLLVQRGDVLSGIIFLILTVLVLPIDGITMFWNTITGNRRWLKYVIAGAMFIIALLIAYYPHG